MVFLQKEGSGRIGHQRTQRKFSFGQNPYQQFPGQRNPFSSYPVDLRFDQLVQKTLPDRKMALCYFEDTPQRTAGSACKIDLLWM